MGDTGCHGAQRGQLAGLHQLVTRGLEFARALGDPLLEALVDLAHHHRFTPNQPQTRLTLAHPQRHHRQPQDHGEPDQHHIARLDIEWPQRHQKMQLPAQRPAGQRLIQIALAHRRRRQPRDL